MEQWETLLRALVKNKQPLPWLVYVDLPIANVDMACQRYLKRAIEDPATLAAWQVRAVRTANADTPGMIEYHLVSDEVGEIASLLLTPLSEQQTELYITATGTDDAMAAICLATFVGQWLDTREWSQKASGRMPDAVQSVSKKDETPAQNPAPLLPVKATQEEWFAWFDWYYRQAWGEPTRIEHMINLLTKSKSQTEKMHALYQEDKRNLPQ